MWKISFVLLFLIGCSSPAPEAVDSFDGQAAWQFTYDLVTDDGPRYRVPNTPGHLSAWHFLYEEMQVPGFAVTWQNFTGAQYETLDFATVAAYRGDAYCSDAERARLQDLQFSNLVAIQEGDGPLLLLGAHWDSKANSSDDPDTPVLGANDGAAGVGLLLQLQRTVPDLPYRVGVVFFDGEDGFEDCHPLAGSMWYQEVGERPDHFILLDMVGDLDARFVREGHSVQSAPDTVDLLFSYGGEPQFTSIGRNVLDDHLPFIDNGVPSMDLIDFGRDSGFPPYWHTTGDTMANISPVMLAKVGDALLATMQDERFAASLADPEPDQSS